jgi:acyl carrier protein
MKSIIIRAINEVLEGKGMATITDINDLTDLRENLGFDSFDLAELTVRIEEATGKDIFENGVISTVGEIYVILNG